MVGDNTLRAACVQNCATPNLASNVERTLALTRDAVADGAQLVGRPAYFSGLESDGARIHPIPYPETSHPALAAFRDAAKVSGVWILLGSLGVKADDGRVMNRGYLLDPHGSIVARYDKIHMFDVDLGAGKVYRESETIAPGCEAVVAETAWGGLGMSICYDLRFAGLYRAMAKAGASILAVPAAFTKTTGEAHWHVLNRARAIETGCFVVAPCQYGTLDGGAQCFGHSLIVDPWGEVLADGGNAEGFIAADLDLAAVSKARSRIPALTHDRDFTMGHLADAAE